MRNRVLIASLLSEVRFGLGYGAIIPENLFTITICQDIYLFCHQDNEDFT